MTEENEKKKSILKKVLCTCLHCPGGNANGTCPGCPLRYKGNDYYDRRLVTAKAFYNHKRDKHPICYAYEHKNSYNQLQKFNQEQLVESLEGLKNVKDPKDSFRSSVLSLLKEIMDPHEFDDLLKGNSDENETRNITSSHEINARLPIPALKPAPKPTLKKTRPRIFVKSVDVSEDSSDTGSTVSVEKETLSKRLKKRKQEESSEELTEAEDEPLIRTKVICR